MPCTKNLKLVFYGSKMAGYGKNSGNQNSIKISSSSHSLANTKEGPQKSIGTVNRGKHPVQNHLRTEQKINITDEATYRKDSSSSCISKLANKVLEDASIFEIQKLIHVVSWTELFPDKHHTSDSMQEIAPSFARSALDHDAEKKVAENIRDTQSKKPEYFDLEYFDMHASSGLRCKNILEQMEKGIPVLSFPTQTIKYEQEHQEEREAILGGECEVKVHKYSTRKKARFQNSYIVCKGDYSMSTTIDLHENLDSYFWTPLNDSSDEKWTEVLKTERHTLTKTHINPSSSTRFLKSDHVKHPSISVLGDKLPSARSASSFEKGALAAENLAEIKEKDTLKDFIGTLKSDNSSGTNDNAKSTAEQIGNRNNPFDPEAQKGELSFLDFQSQKKGTVQKKETKSAHMARTDKSFEENKFIGKEQTVNPSDGENCTGGQIELKLQPLKKNPSTLTSCVEGDSVTQNPVPKYLQDDIDEYVSENIIESTVGPKSSSEEFFNQRIKVDGNKKLFAYDKFLSDSCNEGGVLARYYFYLDYLCHSKMLQPEESSHSFSCEEFHGFSQEEKLAARCHFNNSNRMKDAVIEGADSDFGPCGKNCCTDKRAEVIRPPEEQESKSLFIDSCPRPLSHLASTDQRELGNLHSSKDEMISEIKKIGTSVADSKRQWEISGIAWSSCTHGELKPRSWYVRRPTSANENRRKDSKKSWSPFSGV